MPWLVKLYSRRQLTREERNNKLQHLQRQEDTGECVWSLSKHIQGPTGHNRAKAKGCQGYCFDMYCVAHCQHAEDKPRRSNQCTNPSR